MILITGANGLLGSSISKHLVRQGQQVVALIRKSSDISLLDEIKDQIELRYGDILNPEEITANLSDVKCIIHCAAIVSFHQKDKEVMDLVNIQGTANMVNIALRNNIEYFIHISSVAALGRLTGSVEVAETNTWSDSKLNSNYANSKYLAELEVWRGIEEGLKAVILNPSVIISSMDSRRSSGQLYNYILDGHKFYPNGSINFVDVRDIVRIIGICLDTKITNERFILNGGMISYKEFFEKIANRIKLSPPDKKATKALMRMALIVETIKSLFTGKRTLITRETIMLSGSEIYFSNEKVKRELNFNFVPLDDTLDWACSSVN